jgi:RNA polymerase sigma factor (sigma-70 family)
LDLTTLIDAYRGPLIGLIASWGAPWRDAVEISQDSFAEAWLHRNSCRGDWRDIEIFGRWLRGVAKNQFRSWSRSRLRRTARLTDLSAASLEQVPALEAAAPTEQIEALREAIELLTAPQRQVVFMHYLEETSVREIATLLGVSLKTVEGRLYQARLTLRRLLTDKKAAAKVGMLLLCL